MAFGNLTIDFKSLTKIPIRDRTTLAKSSMASEIFGNLTPSQIAALFPDYYKQQINAMAGQSSGFGAGALSTVKSGGGGGYSGGATGGGGSGGGTAAPAGPPPRPEVISGILKDAGVSVESSSTQYSPTKNASAIQGGIVGIANKFGMDPVDVATFMRYETGGTLDPLQSGPVTHNGHHVGLIQMGDVQQKEVGINLNPNNGPISSLDEQFAGIDKYFEKHGFYKWLKNNPDASVYQKRLAMYATVNAGNPFSINASDAGNGGAPGTVTDKVNDMFSDRNGSHYQRAKEYMGQTFEPILPAQIDGTQPIDTSAPGSDTAIRPLRNDGSTFDPLVLDNLDPRVKDFYMNKASVYEKKALEKAITKLGIDGVNQTTAKYPTANPAMVNTKVIGESDRFSVIGGDIADVDPRLTNLLQNAAKDLPEGYTVKAISGKDARSTGTKNHPNGLAVDVQIYNDKGELLKYDGNSPDWKEYEKLYRSVYIRGQDLYPDQKFIWGGAWQGTASGNGDPMHYQIADPNVRGSSQTSGRYSFENGLDPNHDFARNTPNNQLTADERAYYDESIRSKIIAEKQSITNPNATATPVTAATAPITDTPKVDAAGSDTQPMNLRQPEQTTAAPAAPSGTTNVPSANSAWKLGGTEELGVTNKVDEPYTLSGPEGEMKFNADEEVNVKDGRAEVKNEYKKATEETQQKTDTGNVLSKDEKTVQNTMKMTSRTSIDRNPWANQITDGYSPHSPSYERMLKSIKPDRHWERGNQPVDA
jgi:hypothetical protein